jgi:hypothetical protein
MVAVLGLSSAAADKPPSPAEIEEASRRQLLTVRRVFVDHLTGGETAAQMREILQSSLQGRRLFVVTEKEERADAVLRGGAEDLVFTEVNTSSDGVNAHVNAGASSGSGSGIGRSSRSANGGSLGENESSHSTDRRHESIAAV